MLNFEPIILYKVAKLTVSPAPTEEETEQYLLALFNKDEYRLIYPEIAARIRNKDYKIENGKVVITVTGNYNGQSSA